MEVVPRPNSVDDWKGIGYIHPILCSLMVINLVSLAGLPPTSGFVAKFYIFATIIESKNSVASVISVTISLLIFFCISFLES